MKHPRLIKSSELAEVLTRPDSGVVIDVRSADDFERSHISGAINNCVYEVAFCDRMASIVSDAGHPIYLYGHSAKTHEARMAAEKLCREGFLDVLELREGLDGWIAAGYPVAAKGALQETPIEINGVRTINLEESHIEWTGRNLLNKHHGRIAISSGSLNFDNSTLIGGEFTISMKSITCADLQGSELHDVLIAHLESDDFFDVQIYPEARFTITKASQIPHATPGAPNLKVHGNLAIKGITLPMDFNATAGITPEGHAAAQATLSFDRTLWNVIYGSGKFFRNLAGHLVNDFIEIQVRIVAN